MKQEQHVNRVCITTIVMIDLKTAGSTGLNSPDTPASTPLKEEGLTFAETNINPSGAFIPVGNWSLGLN